MIKVLHVDDNKTDLLIVKLKLEKLSNEIDFVPIDSAPKALEVVMKDRFDCVISDYQMPEMNGLQFLQKLRSTNYTAPFIFLTGQGSEEIAAQALRAGADDYFTKGEGLAHYERLLHNINRLIDAEKAKQSSRKIHEALQVSEERFRMAFKTSPDSININRLSDGLYVEINGGFTEITGYTEEEVIGKSSLEINIWHDSKDRERLVKGLQKDGYVKNLEALFRVKDGSLKTGLMSARIIDLNGEPHILSITRDITPNRVAEKELSTSERRYRKLFQRTSDAVFVVDRKTGRHLEANEAAERLTGRSADELAKLTIGEIIQHDLEGQIPLDNCGKDPFDFGEVTFLRADGSERIAHLECISIDENTLFAIARDRADWKKQ